MEASIQQVKISGEGSVGPAAEAEAVSALDAAASNIVGANESAEDAVGVNTIASEPIDQAGPVETVEPVAAAAEVATEAIIKPEEVRNDPTPSQSAKQQFDDAAAASIIDLDAGKVAREGGTYASQGTNQLASDAESRGDNTISLEDKEDREGLFELYGFSVSFIVPGTKAELAGSRVRVYGKTLADLTLAVQGREYTHTFEDGTKLVCRITEGLPRIAYDEVEKLVMGDAGWARP